MVTELESFKMRLMNGGFRFCYYNYGNSMNTVRLDKIKFFTYKGTTVLCIDGSSGEGMNLSKFGLKFSLKDISDVVDMGLSLKFTVMPYVVGAKKFGPSTVILNQKSF
jgi:hypothetical protein